MKIALCISGQPRYLDNGYQHIYKNLLSKHEMDIFIHTWWDDNLIGKRFDFSQHGRDRIGVWESGTIQKIENFYKPKDILIEKPKIFNIDTFKNLNEYWKTNFSESNSNNSISMWYSILNSNKLKKDYESKNNFRYDLVIRCRFDILFDFFYLDLDSIDSDFIYVQSIGQIRKNKIYKNSHLLPSDLLNDKILYLNDQFAISNSENMDYYSEVYNNCEFYWNNFESPPIGESALTFHLMYNKMKIKISDSLYLNNIIKI